MASFEGGGSETLHHSDRVDIPTQDECMGEDELHYFQSDTEKRGETQAHDPDRASAPTTVNPPGSSCEAAQPKCVAGVLTYRFSEAEKAILNTHKTEVAERTVLGHFPISSPGYKVLAIWAKENLHASCEEVTQIGSKPCAPKTMFFFFF